MNNGLMKHSSAWISFSYLSFGFAAFMLALGLWMMPIDLWGKGYLTMGILMLVQTTVNVTKTLRDNQDEFLRVARAAGRPGPCLRSRAVRRR